MMTALDRLEFDGIRDEQTRLRRSMDTLDRRIDLLDRRMESSVAAKLDAPHIGEPPPLPLGSKGEPSRTTERVVAAGEWRDVGAANTPDAIAPSAAKTAAEAAAPPASQQTAAKAENAEPLELRVGTFWLARIGIVILLTGLVFLGNYAYHRVVPLLGPWEKLALLTLAGGALTGLGAWLERSRETMRSYARVLMAGGAATLYYTAYAAHFVERLRVIDSPIVGGTLLLAMAGAFIWYADKRRSESLALPGLLLAYYTSAINAVGAFTLFSNLLLTSAAVFFLARHRWTRISYASLAATYGTYAFWRFHQIAQTGGGGEFGMGIAFLAGYWVLFTAAVFLGKPGALHGSERLAFLTANNGAFFAFGVHHFAVHRPEAFWIFSTGFGAMLLALAAVAWRLRTEDRALDGAYLAQGLGLMTLGFAQKFTGPQLAVLLAVESVVLRVVAMRRHALICGIASALCAVAAAFLAIEQMPRTSPAALGASVAALLFVNAWLVKRREPDLERCNEHAFGFSVLGLAVIGAMLWHAVPAAWQPAAYALAACAGLLALRLRLLELALPSQGFLLAALWVFVARHGEIAAHPWWMPIPLVAAALALMHWWQRQRAASFSVEIRALAQLACAGVAVAAGVCWMHAFIRGDAWLVAASAAAFGTLLYGATTGAWALALAGQVFSVLAVVLFIGSVGFGHPAWAMALAPVANLAATSLVAAHLAAGRFPTLPSGGSFAFIAQIYRLAALALAGGWAFEYAAPAWRVAFFAGGGAGLILGGAVTHNRERSTAGAVFALAGLALFWMRFGHGVVWQELPAILAVPLSLRIGRRLSGEQSLPSEIRNALVAAAMASVWLWVTRWTTWHGGSERLTAMWALLALAIFAAGLALRERLYRIGGFALLGLAMARLFFVDVWRFDSLGRIASFLALGAVLLTLSFVYNRFAETLRRWL